MSSDSKDDVTSPTASRLSGEWARIATGTGLRRQSYLLAIAGLRAGRRYRLGRETYLGRDPGSHIQLQGGEVSRQHVRLSLSSDGECILEDVGSRNGTLVNGVRAERQLLHAGDLIQVGEENAFLFTQHSALEDLILQEQRMESIARVTGGLAHEFNNLMTVVLTELEYLRERFGRGLTSREEALDALKAMEAATRRSLRLTQQVLGAGRRGPAGDRRPVDLQVLAEEVTSLLKPTFGSITLRLEVPPNLSLIGDAALLHQALLNLCLHACEEMPEGGALALRAEAPDPDQHPGPFGKAPYVVLSVQDTGPGHDEEGRQQLLESLFTGAHVRLNRPGLAAVYEAVNLHGGRVEIDSAVGWGTTFRLILPSGGVLPSEARSKGTAPSAQIVRRTVLLVEDAETERALAAGILEGMGLRVLQARDGREAVRLFTANRGHVDLVLLDMILPNLSGKETFRWLRKLQPETRVVLASGYLDASRVSDLLDAGARGFVQKPYDSGRLRAVVDRALADTIAR